MNSNLQRIIDTRWNCRFGMCSCSKSSVFEILTGVNFSQPFHDRAGTCEHCPRVSRPVLQMCTSIPGFYVSTGGPDPGAHGSAPVLLFTKDTVII